MKRLSAHSSWIAVGVLAVLGIWLYFDLKKPVREPGESPKIADLAGVKADDVTRVEITSSGATIVLARTGSTWNVEQPVRVSADAEAVKQALDTLLGQSSDFVFEGDAPELARYGLQKPQKFITLVAGGKRVVLQFGDQDPSKSSVFTRVAETGRVFLAASSGVDGLTAKNVDAWRDKTVLSVRASDIERIRIARGAGAEIVVTKSGNDWSLEAPLRAPADAFTVDGICDTLATLKADRFVPSPSAPASYGLDKPGLTVEFSAKGGAQYALNVGKATEGGESYYAMRAGSTDVVEIAKTARQALDKGLADFRSKKLINCTTDSVERIAVTTKKASWEVRKAGADWVFVRPTPGTKADALDVDNVLLDGTGNADKWIADRPDAAALSKYGLTVPQKTIKLTIKGGATKLLEIGAKAPGGDYYARGSDTGDAVYTLSAWVADRLGDQPKPAKK